MRDPRCCISYWFPLLQKTGVPVPKTVIIDAGDHVSGYVFSDQPIPQKLLNAIAKAAKEVGGYPAFLRSGHTSNKHSWSRTCFLASESQIDRNVREISEYCECCDLLGLPSNIWVVREFLPIEPAFRAFNDTPICKERRYWIKDGKVVGHHPYWPPESIQRPSDPNWDKHLAWINVERPDEVAELTALSEKAGRVFYGAWSIDWLWIPSRGWVCIDMAEAERSYCWREHPNAPKILFEAS